MQKLSSYFYILYILYCPRSENFSILSPDLIYSNPIFVPNLMGKMVQARRKRKTLFLRQTNGDSVSYFSIRWSFAFLIVLMLLCSIFHFNFLHNLMILNKFIQFKTAKIFPAFNFCCSLNFFLFSSFPLFKYIVRLLNWNWF